MPEIMEILRAILNPTSLTAPELIQHMRDMVQSEVAAQRAEFSRRMARPVEKRVSDGWCLSGLGWRKCEAGDASIAEFSLHEGNDSRLREGDYVRLSSPGGGDAVQQATIYREEENALWLKLREGVWDELWLTGPGARCLVDADFLDMEPFYQRALEAVSQTSIGRECILPFLEQTEKEEAADFLEEHEKLADTQMNERQRDAVAECLAALPDASAALIRDRYFSRRSVDELAAGSGQTAMAVYQTLCRLRRRLAECIRQRLRSEPSPPISHAARP